MNRPVVERTDQGNEDINHELPGILRAVAVGCAVGVVSVFIAVGGAMYLRQHSLAEALALGGMSAVWGGLGFGAMLGGTLHVVRHSNESRSSTKALTTVRATRELGILDVPSPDGADVAARNTPEDQVEDSSQVA